MIDRTSQAKTTRGSQVVDTTDPNWWSTPISANIPLKTLQQIGASGNSPPATEIPLGNPNEQEFIFDNDPLGSAFPIAVYSVIISLGGLIFGYDIGTLGGLIDMPAFQNRFGDNEINSVKSFNNLTKGILIGSSSIGGFIGGLLSMVIIPPSGLRGTIFTSASIYALGNIIILMSDRWYFVLLGRVLNGITNGIVTVSCPMLISELAPLKMRGGLISIFQLLITAGILLGSLVLYASNSTWGNTDVLQYMLPLVVGIIISILCGITIWFVPESPYWYCHSLNSIEKSRDAIARARSLQFNDPNILRIVQIIFDQARPPLQDDYENGIGNDGYDDNAKFEKSIRKGQPKYLLRTLTGIGLLCFQQLTGINYFFFFGTTIFNSVGIANIYYVPIFFSVINLVFSCFSIKVINSLQRTTLLLFGSMFLSLFMIIFSSVGLISSVNGNSLFYSYIMIISSCGFIATFSMSWGPLSGVIVSELYPSSIKVKAMSICGCISWLATFIVSLTIPALSQLMGFSLGFVFVGFILLGSIFVVFLVPETKNVSIEELNERYENGTFSRFIARHKVND